MDLKEWKNAYPDATAYYDAFHGSEEGQKVWELAHDTLYADSEEEREEDENEEDPLDMAYDIVIEGMESWLLHDVDDCEYEKASEWFETMREELLENIYAGLT